MDNAAISVFDSPYFDYAVRMYVSLRAFNPSVLMLAGDLGLSQSERNFLSALGVRVLTCDRAHLLKDRGLRPTFGHFLLHSYLSEISWDRVLWIDADTLILDDISEVYSIDADLVGHPGRSAKGVIWTLGEIYSYYPPGAKVWLANHLPCHEDAPYFTGGLWCTRSGRLLEFLDSLLDIIPSEFFPGEPPLFTSAIQHLGLSSHQLDPQIWNFSRELLHGARLENGKINYGDGLQPKTAAFSETDAGVKASSEAIELFYDTVVRKKFWKRPAEPLIRYLTEGGYTQAPAEKLTVLNSLVTNVISKNIPGELVECGVWRGGSALVILNACGDSDRRVHLFDTFEGMPPPSKEDFQQGDKYPGTLREEGGTFGTGSLDDTGVAVVRGLFDRMGMDLEKLSINKGRIGDYSSIGKTLRKWGQSIMALAGIKIRQNEGLLAKFPSKISFLHIDVDFYEPYRWLLFHLYRRVSHGGAIVFDDYGYWIGAKRSVDEFLVQSGEKLQETTTSQRYVIKSQKVFLDLDDFCEEYMTKERWELLHDLRKLYRNLKVTMFTIPGKSSTKWLQWVRSEIRWIEMVVHGTNHEDPSEWLTSPKTALEHLESVYNRDIYAQGFKAPWWRVSKEVYDALREAGFWVATNKTNKFVKPTDSLNFRYDDGDEILADIHYRHPFFDTWHGHVQSQREYGASLPNGLEDIFDRISRAWHPEARFGFYSELFG